jgi:peptidoglycan-N-acetylglucosamine deacetylase
MVLASTVAVVGAAFSPDQPQHSVPVPPVARPADPGRIWSALPVTGKGAAAGPQQGLAEEPAGGRVLYLTFDDGPNPTWTPQILAVLARYDAKATFFEVGAEVRRHPVTAAQVRAAGHRVGNHTEHHAHLTRLSGARLRQEISHGVRDARCLRPPYGQVNPAVRSAAAAAGQRLVLWTVDTDDWAKPGSDRVRGALLHGVRPGAVILLHDGGGDRRQTVAALKAALPLLIARGYRFRSYPAC